MTDQPTPDHPESLDEPFRIAIRHDDETWTYTDGETMPMVDDQPLPDHPESLVPPSQRTPYQEGMVRFGYYAQMASVQFPTAAAELLVKHGYEDPREVMKELSDWCYLAIKR